MSTKTNKEKTEFVQSKTCKVFSLVKNKEGKIVIGAAGQMISSKKFDTIEQAERYIESKPYELIVNLMFIVIKLSKENENSNENPQNK